ncbi:hypothetical protein ACFYWY_34740 [Streptomyces sp. NPDC002870]|uniref:hypothetical protein n=1 Tax=Streptomyces sp. NPDC002870 TaxID=3364666 RepID=UPI00367FD8E6
MDLAALPAADASVSWSLWPLGSITISTTRTYEQMRVADPCPAQVVLLMGS